MRTRSVLLAVVVALVLPIGIAWAGNPIPGVGIVVKRPPGSSTAFITPGGFFGPGSEPFEGSVGLEGRCSHDCGGCDDNCAGNEDNPDGRIDYEADFATGPFAMVMQPTVMYSIAPIEVMINGSPTLFDVFVSISGQAQPADDPIPGTLLLPLGESLDTGTSSTVLQSSFDVHCTITFADHTTGVGAGSSLEYDFHIELQNAALPITRVADGTAAGHIVLGLGGSDAVAFTYASAGGEFSMKMLSLHEQAPVPVQETSWGKVKALYR